MNLFDDQKQNVPSQASPLIDLDNVYGARLDENHPATPGKSQSTTGISVYALSPAEGTMSAGAILESLASTKPR